MKSIIEIKFDYNMQNSQNYYFFKCKDSISKVLFC